MPPPDSMKRRTSMTRIRKLSNSIINAIRPSSSQTAEQPRLTRRISVNDISKPLQLGQYSADHFIAANASHTAPRPRRPARPSMDGRPQAIYSPQAGEQEQRLNALLRSERRREEELAYGTRSRHLNSPSSPELSPSRAPRIAQGTPAEKGAIPFPRSSRDKEPRERHHRQQTGESTAGPRSPPGQREAVYSAFAPVKRTPSSISTKTMPERRWAEDATPPPTRAGPPPPANRDVGARGTKLNAETVVPGNRTSVYCTDAPATVGRKGAIRRTSKTSNPPLPSPQLNHLFGRSEDALVATSPRPTGLQRSHSAATHSTLRSPRAPHPPSPLRPKPVEPRNVPHDVHERERRQSVSSVWSDDEKERVVIDYGGIVTKNYPMEMEPQQGQASMDLRYPPVPQVVRLSGPDPQRASSFKAEVGHVAEPGPSRARRAEPEPPVPGGSTQRERAGRTRDGRGPTYRTEEFSTLTLLWNDVATKNGVPVPVGKMPELLPNEWPVPETAPLRVQKEFEGEASRLRRIIESRR
ncbi:uncharacterized protein TRAVEDRAFT_46062 [Trametes versicolor FP-101664 SS1]|uniref:uncharacterized protein n=1 Tax=Trametes versicolor (strain FP-101664) TaxID=717944 RepID=UPI0004622B71|nr:uncharacterized protein TRAVEDRAFT_46062 [Trametes versicolor FP-101664 SS1]EIW60822.1 hypothetical protein TRAVEDRAFT_46062 [Trametes versicolor FP-101664 SS1]